MSITFWAPEAPTIRVRPYPEDDPDYEENQSTLPELNLSNSNAVQFLLLLGIEPDDCGTILPSQQEDLFPRLLVLANSQAAREPALRELTVTQSVQHQAEGNLVKITRGPRVIDCGLRDEQVQHYATRLLDLFKQAHMADYYVSWG